MLRDKPHTDLQVYRFDNMLSSFDDLPMPLYAAAMITATMSNTNFQPVKPYDDQAITNMATNFNDYAIRIQWTYRDFFGHFDEEDLSVNEILFIFEIF
jgi:hypothetical protein